MSARRTLPLAALLTVGVLVQGCTKSENNEPVTITMVYSDQNTYELNYGHKFAVHHPEIQVKVIPFDIFEENPDRWWEIVHKEKPDIIAMNSLSDYRALSAEGGLKSLDVIMKQEKYDITPFMPEVIDTLRSNGRGTINGLAPDISSYALFYNKGLFNQYKIPYPSSNMTWKEMMDLADRFPVETSVEDARVYGYYGSGYRGMENFGGLVEWMGLTAGLSLVDLKSDQVLIGSAEWKAVFERCIASLRQGTVRLDGEITQLFSKGRAAMRIGGLEVLGQMDQYRSENPNAPVVDWGIVPLPHEPAGPNFSPWLLSTIFGIQADSPHQKAAWELIKYILSEENLRESAPWGIVSRSAMNTDRDGRSLEPFWTIPQAADRNPWEEIPMSFRMKVRYLCEEMINDVLTNGSRLDEALQKVQTAAQEEWLRTKIKASVTVSSSPTGG